MISGYVGSWSYTRGSAVRVRLSRFFGYNSQESVFKLQVLKALGSGVSGF